MIITISATHDLKDCTATELLLSATSSHETKNLGILAEELGHHYTSSGNILDMSVTANRKQEYHARFWAYNRLVGLQGIIACYKANCLAINEMAEYLDVTEEFLKEALECYRSKYGTAKQIDNYIIGFEPNLYVIELFESQ